MVQRCLNFCVPTAFLEFERMERVGGRLVGDVVWGPAAWLAAGVVIGCCFMAGVLPLLRRCYTLFFSRCVQQKRFVPAKGEVKTVHVKQRMVPAITDADLRWLAEQLDENGSTAELPWEFAIEKTSPSVSYSAMRREPEDGGPTQILSTTVFENCSTQLARDFYMDGEFRKQWDSTLVVQEQLDLCEETGTEVGRIVKKFPLLTPREYVLAWRVWEGEDSTFYCFIKACEHELVPRQAKFKRVEVYTSGWRIRKVPGRNACEISMIHQEDLCMQREMAKMAFNRGIWSYVKKMDTNLRKFAVQGDQFCQGQNAVTFAHKVPSGVLPLQSGRSSSSVSAVRTTSRFVAGDESSAVDMNPHVGEAVLVKKRLTRGLILVGGAVLFSQSSASWGAKIAAAYLIKRLVKPQLPSKRSC